MHKFTSNIPIIVNNISTMQDVSAQNMDLSGSLDVSQNTTIGGTLNVIGDETVGGTLGVTNTTTLTGNVGIGGASGSHNLLVTGSERITGNLDVSGDLNVNGNFNFNEIIQNITTVNNEVIISTQLDISNQGTGPALKVSQFGVGEDQDVAVFNAGDEGDAFKIDYAGNSHFYKPVDMNNTLLIRNGWNVPQMLSGFGEGGAESGTITFSKTFDSVPSVVATINRAKDNTIFIIHIYNITRTNFTYTKRFFNGNIGGAPIESFHWIAMGI